MRLRSLLSLAAALALLAPATAGADFQTLYDDYRADGAIDGCSQSPAELSAALGDIPADVRVYDPGFADAINLALEQSATVCGKSPAQAAAQNENETIAADGSPGPVLPERAGVVPAETGRDMPPLLIALTVLLAAALGAAAMIGLRSLRNKSSG